MVRGRLKRESNPMPGTIPGFSPQHDSTGNGDFVDTSPVNPLPVTVSNQSTGGSVVIWEAKNFDIPFEYTFVGRNKSLSWNNIQPINTQAYKDITFVINNNYDVGVELYNQRAYAGASVAGNSHIYSESTILSVPAGAKRMFNAEDMPIFNYPTLALAFGLNSKTSVKTGSMNIYILGRLN